MTQMVLTVVSGEAGWANTLVAIPMVQTTTAVLTGVVLARLTEHGWALHQFWSVCTIAFQIQWFTVEVYVSHASTEAIHDRGRSAFSLSPGRDVATKYQRIQIQFPVKARSSAAGRILTIQGDGGRVAMSFNGDLMPIAIIYLLLCKSDVRLSTSAFKVEVDVTFFNL